MHCVQPVRKREGSNEGWCMHDGRSVSSETANQSTRLVRAAAADE